MGKRIDWTTWDQKTKRFSSYVILHKGNVWAKVCLLHPADGVGRLTALVHVLGLPPVAGYASGCGYDKASAAVADGFSVLLSEGLDKAVPSQAGRLIKELAACESTSWMNIPLLKNNSTAIQVV